MLTWFKRSSSLELKPLPMNLPQFNEWSERIIKQANLPTSNLETQRFALAAMIAQTNPTEFFRPDEYYVNCLRKAASDQLAVQIMEDIKLERQKRIEEQNKKQASDATTSNVVPLDGKPTP